MLGDAFILQFAFILIFAICGLCAGSFASAVIYREKKNISWFNLRGAVSRSSCPSCNSVLIWRDLIPVLSWARNQGKCRYCHTKIPLFYPAVELLCCFCAMMVYLWVGMGTISMTFLICLPFLVSIIYLGLFEKKFSLRLVAIIASIGMLSFVIQLSMN